MTKEIQMTQEVQETDKTQGAQETHMTKEAHKVIFSRPLHNVMYVIKNCWRREFSMELPANCVGSSKNGYGYHKSSPMFLYVIAINSLVHIVRPGRNCLLFCLWCTDVNRHTSVYMSLKKIIQSLWEEPRLDHWHIIFCSEVSWKKVVCWLGQQE